MATTLINMEVESDVAALYRNTPAEDRTKLSVLWAVLLREYQACPTPLQRLMDEIGAKAKARGLSAGKLESILHAG